MNTQRTTHADGCPAARNPRHGCSCATSTVHAGPADGSAVTPCCGRSPFELPHSDRMTHEPALVTCTTQTSATDTASSYPPLRHSQSSVAPAGEDHGAPNSDIWRWKVPSGFVDYHGAGLTDTYVEVVTYADHVAALAVAEKKGYNVGYTAASVEFLTVAALEATGPGDPRYAKGFADSLDKATEWLRDPEHHPSDEAKAWAWAYAEAIDRLLRAEGGA